MKLDDNLTKGITATWKVTVELLLIDVTMLSLDNNHLRLRSKMCAVLGSMRKYNPCKGCGPDHHGVASEDRASGHWEDLDPDTTISSCASTTDSSSEGPPYYNKIEWISAAGGEEI